MTIEKLKETFDTKFQQYFKPISECSKDENNCIALIDRDEPKMFDFDDISEYYAKNHYRCKKAKSVDSVYFKDDKLYLIEYKNQDKPNWNDVKMKLHDSMLIFMDSFSFGKLELNKTEFIVVTQKYKGNTYAKRHLNTLAKTSCPTKLIFLEKGYGIKISEMNVDEAIEFLK